MKKSGFKTFKPLRFNKQPQENLPNNYTFKKRVILLIIVTAFALLSFVAMLLIIFLVKK